MKFNKIFVLFISVLLIALVGCEDRSDLTAPEAPNTGTADFSSFVSTFQKGQTQSSKYRDISQT